MKIKVLLLKQNLLLIKNYSATDALNFLAPVISRVNTKRIPNKIALEILTAVEWYGNLSKKVLESKVDKIENLDYNIDSLFNKGFLSKIVYQGDEYYYFNEQVICIYEKLKNSVNFLYR